MDADMDVMDQDEAKIDCFIHVLYAKIVDFYSLNLYIKNVFPFMKEL